jgi:hypothetical protein
MQRQSHLKNYNKSLYVSGLCFQHASDYLLVYVQYNL